MKQQYVLIKNGQLFNLADESDIIYRAYNIARLSPEQYPANVAEALQILRNRGFLIVTLAQAYRGEIGVPQITNGEQVFKNEDEAVKWLLMSGKTSSERGARMTLKRNLEGKTKTAYGMTFRYQNAKSDINIESLFLT